MANYDAVRRASTRPSRAASRNRRAASAWTQVSEVDKQLGELIDNIPNQPKTELSAQRLETAAAHLRDAKRLLLEVEAREVPLYEESS